MEPCVISAAKNRLVGDCPVKGSRGYGVIRPLVHLFLPYQNRQREAIKRREVVSG
jgi:hypothetical protein